MTNTNYTKEAENYKNKDPDIHFIPNLDLSNSKDLNCDLTVILSLEFGDHSDIEIDFKPAQISDNKLVIE